MLLFNFLCAFCLMVQVHCHTISKSITKIEINDNTVIDNLFGLDYTTDSGKYDKKKTNKKWSLNNYKIDREAPYINLDFDLTKTVDHETTTKKVGLWRKFVHKFKKKPKTKMGRIKKTTKSYIIDYYGDETDNSTEKPRKYTNSKKSDKQRNNVYGKRKRQARNDNGIKNKRFTSKEIDIKPYLDWLKNTTTPYSPVSTNDEKFSTVDFDDKKIKPKFKIKDTDTYRTTVNTHPEDFGYKSIDNKAISNLSQLLSAMSNRMNQLKRIYNLKELMAQTTHLRNENTTPSFKTAWPAATLQTPDEMLSNIAQIESMLDEIKMNSMHAIAQERPSLADLITNTVSETTFEVDPLLERTAVNDNDQLGGMTAINKYLKLSDDANFSNASPLSKLKFDEKHEISRRACTNEKKKLFKIKRTNLCSKEKPTTCPKCRLFTCKCNDKRTTQFVTDMLSLEKISDEEPKIRKPYLKKVDDYDMLSVYENMLLKNHRDNVNKLLTSSQTPFFYKWRYDPNFSKRSLGTLTDSILEQNMENLDNDGEEIQEDNTTVKEKNADNTNSKITTNFLTDDYVDGYKSYLNFQKELNKDKFSNMVRYQAHRHHTVDEIGKFINNKIPKMPDRSKRKFNDESDTMEDQDVSTKGDESWFKKHFYLFIDNNPPKKYHTSENMTVKLPGALSKLNQSPQESKNQRKLDVHDVLQDYNVGSAAKKYHILEIPDSKITQLDKFPTTVIKKDEPRIMMKMKQMQQFNEITPNKNLQNCKKASSTNIDTFENKMYERPSYYNYNAMRTRRSLSHVQEEAKTSNPIDLLGQDQDLFKSYDDLNIPKKREDKTSKNFIKKMFEHIYSKSRKSKQKKSKRNIHNKRNPRYNPLKKIRYFFKTTDSILDTSDENLLNVHITTFKPIKYDKPQNLDKMKEAIPNIEDESPSSDPIDVMDYNRLSTTKDDNLYITDEKTMTTVTTTDSDTDSDIEEDESQIIKPIQDIKNMERNLKFLTYNETTMLASSESINADKMSESQYKTTMNKIKNEINKVEMKIDLIDKNLPTENNGKPEQTLMKKLKNLHLNNLDKIEVAYNDIFDAEAERSTVDAKRFTVDAKRSTLDAKRSTVRIDVIFPPTFGKPVLQTITESKINSPTTFNVSKKSIYMEELNDNSVVTQRTTLKLYSSKEKHIDETPANSKLEEESTHQTLTETKQVEDYFNDLVIWNGDILNADSPTNPPWMKILNNYKIEPEFSTYSIKNLQDEVAELKYRLSDIKFYGNNLNKLMSLGSTNTKETNKLTPTTTKMNVFKKGIEYALKDNIQINSKVMESSILEDISDSHGKGFENNNQITPVTQTYRRPEQYFNTPIPMPMKDFEKFLKEHEIDVDSVTAPNTLNVNNIKNKENTEDYYEKSLTSKYSAKKSDETDTFKKIRSKFKKHNKQSDFDYEYSTTTAPEYAYPYNIDNSFNNNFMVHKNKANKKKQNNKFTLDDLDLTIIDFDNEYTDTKATTASYFEDPFHVKEKAKKLLCTTKKTICKLDEATDKMANKVEACKNKSVNKLKKIKSDAMKKIKSTSTKAAKFIKSTTEKTLKDLKKTMSTQINKTKAKLKKLKCKLKCMTSKKPKHPALPCTPCPPRPTNPTHANFENAKFTETLFEFNDKRLDDVNDFYNKLTTEKILVEQTTDIPVLNPYTKNFEEAQDKPRRVMITNVMSRYDIIYDDHYRAITKSNKFNHIQNSRSVDNSLGENETREIISIVEVIEALENFTRPSVVIHVELPTFYEPDKNAPQVLQTTTKSIWNDYVMKYISGIALIELLTKFGVIKSIDSITDGSDKIVNANEVFSENREKNQEARHLNRRKRRKSNMDSPKITTRDNAVSNASLVYDLKEIDGNKGRFERKLRFLPFFQLRDVDITATYPTTTTETLSETYSADADPDQHTEDSTTEDLFTSVIRVTMIPSKSNNFGTIETINVKGGVNKRKSPNNIVTEIKKEITTGQTTSTSSATSETTSQPNTKREHLGHRKHIQNIFTKKLRTTTSTTTQPLTTVPAVATTTPTSPTMDSVGTDTKSSFEEPSTSDQLNNESTILKDNEYLESDKEMVQEVYFEPSIRLATDTPATTKAVKKKKKTKKKKHHPKSTTESTTIKTAQVDVDIEGDDDYDEDDEDSDVYIEPLNGQKRESKIHSHQTNEPNSNKKETKVEKRDVHKDNIFTAKNVAALEVVVDLTKSDDTHELQGFISTPVYPNSGSDPNSSVATNSIQVRIAIPYSSHDKRRSAIDKMKVRKVFTAKLSSPVDLEYQIHSIEEPISYSTTKASVLFQRKNSPIEDTTSMSPGVYLLVGYPTKLPDDAIELKPVDFDINKCKFVRKITTSVTPKITTTKNMGKVTLSKEFIAALNEQLAFYNLLENTTNSKRSLEYKSKVNRRKKRFINWDSIKRYFGHDNVLKCRCEVNKPMCRACASCDAVMAELIFELDYLSKYMHDHCPEIQTFFWMNPSGGKRLRETVKNIDKSLQDCYKKVKTKCDERTCKLNTSPIEKRYFDEPTPKNIENLLINLEGVANDLETAKNFNFKFDDRLKRKGYSLINSIKQCVSSIFSDDHVVKPRQINKSSYSLDNISVNIICNPEIPTLPAALDTSMNYNFPEIQMDKNIIGYTLNSEDFDSEKKKSKSLRKLFFRNERRRKKEKLNKELVTKLPLSKRQVTTQIEPPIITDGGGSFWQDYVNKIKKPRTARHSLDNNFLKNPKTNVSKKDSNEITTTNETTTESTNIEEILDFDVYSDNIQSLLKSLGAVTLPVDDGKFSDTTIQTTSFRIPTSTSTTKKVTDKLITLTTKKDTLPTTSISHTMPTTKGLKLLTIKAPLKATTKYKTSQLQRKSLSTGNTTPLTTTVESFLDKFKSATEKILEKFKYSHCTKNKNKYTTEQNNIGSNFVRTTATSTPTNLIKKLYKSSLIMNDDKTKNKASTKKIKDLRKDKQELLESVQKFEAKVNNRNGITKNRRKAKQKGITIQPTKEELSPKYITKNLGSDAAHVKDKQDDFPPTTKIDRHRPTQATTQATKAKMDTTEIMMSDNFYTIVNHQDKPSGKSEAAKVDGLLKKFLNNVGIKIVPEEKRKVDNELHLRDLREIHVKENILSDIKKNMKKRDFLHRKSTSKVTHKIKKSTTTVKPSIQKTTKNSFKEHYENDDPQEAYEPQPGYICDLHATFEHIRDLSSSLAPRDFENYVRNINCYKFKKIPDQFYVKPCDKSIYNRTSNSKISKLKHNFQNLPRWDWIANKRSLKSIEHNEKEPADYYQYDDGEELNVEGDVDELIGTIREKKELPNFERKVTEDDIDEVIDETDSKIKSRDDRIDFAIGENKEKYDRFYKTEGGVYRRLKRKVRRSVDFSDLVDGLRNLPPLEPPKDEVYAMRGDSVILHCYSPAQKARNTLDFKGFLELTKYEWDTDRKEMLGYDNVVVEGPNVYIKNVKGINVGNYSCSKNKVFQRSVHLSVTALPQFNTVFVPVYECRTGCSYQDLRAMQCLSHVMADEACSCDRHCTVRIDDPTCLKDMDDDSQQVRAIVVLSTAGGPRVRCNVQCRRDLQSSLALLTAANAPNLAPVTVILSSEYGNRTFTPSSSYLRRSVVTRQLKKRDCNHHREYRRLASRMPPGGVDVVVSCPAGYFLIREHKICVACPRNSVSSAGQNSCSRCPPGTHAAPGAARCRLARRTRRYDCWLYPPCGCYYIGWGAIAVATCIALALCGALRAAMMRKSCVAPTGGFSADGAYVDRPLTTGKCSSTLFTYSATQTGGRRMASSKVILNKFLNRTPPSSRATESQETKFEIWKEKNNPPPLPPIDFDSSTDRFGE